MGQADRQNRNARRERELEAEVRALRKKLAEKDEVIELLKKSIGIFFNLFPVYFGGKGTSSRTHPH